MKNCPHSQSYAPIDQDSQELDSYFDAQDTSRANTGRKTLKKTPLFSSDLVVLTATALVFINDHFLKGSKFPSILTGKISDFCGLFFFPFLIYDFLVMSKLINEKKLASFLAISLTTGIFFTTIKVSSAANAMMVSLYTILGLRAKICLDSDDLCALIVLPLGIAYFVSKEKKHASHG